MRKDTVGDSVIAEPRRGIVVSQLLRPTAHFEHPRDVLAAEHLSEQEKRAILASWASDQYAVESIPALRHYPGSSGAVSLVEVLAALRTLDGGAGGKSEGPALCGQTHRPFDLRRLVPMRRRRSK